MTMIVEHYRKVKNYFPVKESVLLNPEILKGLVFCSLFCYMLLEALWCKHVLGFASVVKKLDKKEKFSKCRETLIFL